MAKKSPRTAPGDVEPVATSPEREKEWCHDDDLNEAALDLYRDIETGFTDQIDRVDDILDYWDVYNCKLGQRQFYNGMSKIFVPIVRDAVKARCTRFVNQMFPQNGRNVEVTTEDGTMPSATVALLEDYVRRNRLRTRVMPALLRNGDMEGQYTVYCSWVKRTRHVVWRQDKPLQVDETTDDPDESAEDIEEEELVDAYPGVEVIADTDLLVLPATADSLSEALAQGGSVTVLRRWSKAMIKQKIAEEEIDEEYGETLIEEMKDAKRADKKDKAKEMVDAAGIKAKGKFALVYETWTMLAMEDGEKDKDGKTTTSRRLCRVYYGGEEKVLSIKRNPYWCDRLPIMSVPAEKVQGSFRGQSQVASVADLQYQANDAVNEGMDSAAYAMLPIVMTDPEKNPKVGSMILNVAAIWETSPKDTQFAQFPPLWKDALEIVASCKAQIMQSLSVNPSQITQGTGKKKQNQAEVSQEQQIDLLTTADAVTVLEEGILTPLVSFMLELDHQYRDGDVFVRQYGQMGVQAQMERIPPTQMDRRYQFKWLGVEAAKNAQMIQQQIAALNVLRGIPAAQYQGYVLDVAPAIVQMVENVFGPRLGPLVFKNIKSQLSMDAEQENKLLEEGIALPVHPMDDHPKHMQAHLQALQATGDPTGAIRVHLIEHQQAMAKMAAAQQQAQGQGSPGVPGGAGPGVAGTPRPGGQPSAQRPVQGPPGQVANDQMHDPSMMPRRAG